MSEKKWQKPRGKTPTGFEDLRTHPDELRLIAQALAPPQSHDACTNVLYSVLRFWNFRSPRLDRHMKGEWLFRSHEEFVFQGVVTSVRNSQRALANLEKAGLIERRKAHLGDRLHVLHIAPSTEVLKLLEQINDQMFQHLDKHQKPRVMRYMCDRSIECGPGNLDRKTLVYIADRMRSDPAYGKAQRQRDIEDAMVQAQERYNAKPDPFVSKGLPANSGGYAHGLPANSGGYQPDETPNMAVTNKENGDKENGDLVSGDSGKPSGIKYQGENQSLYYAKNKVVLEKQLATMEDIYGDDD